MEDNYRPAECALEICQKTRPESLLIEFVKAVEKQRKLKQGIEYDTFSNVTQMYEEYVKKFEFLEKDVFHRIRKDLARLVDPKNPFIILIMNEVNFEPEL